MQDRSKYFDRFTSFVCFSEAYVLSFYGNRQPYMMGENSILTAMNWRFFMQFKKKLYICSWSPSFSVSADRLHNGFLFLYLESIILNKDEEDCWMTGGNMGMLPIRIILEIYPICHGASGTEVLGNSCGLWYRWIYSRRDGAYAQGCCLLVECISAYQLQEGADEGIGNKTS